MKHCEQCEKELPPRNNYGQYCSMQCTGLAQQDKAWAEFRTDEYWENITEINCTARRWLLLKIRFKCMGCGEFDAANKAAEVRLEVEHLDGNRRNCSLDNLTILCPKCMEGN